MDKDSTLFRPAKWPCLPACKTCYRKIDLAVWRNCDLLESLEGLESWICSQCGTCLGDRRFLTFEGCTAGMRHVKKEPPHQQLYRLVYELAGGGMALLFCYVDALAKFIWRFQRRAESGRGRVVHVSVGVQLSKRTRCIQWGMLKSTSAWVSILLQLWDTCRTPQFWWRPCRRQRARSATSFTRITAATGGWSTRSPPGTCSSRSLWDPRALTSRSPVTVTSAWHLNLNVLLRFPW